MRFSSSAFQFTDLRNLDCASESLYYSTFAHPPVLAQHVARGAFTLVRAHDVDTAEGAQQRILGALVDVWNREQEKRQVTHKDCAT